MRIAGTEESPATVMDIVLRPSRITAVLATAVAVLFLLHGLALFSIFFLGYDYVLGLIPLFHVNYESNLPTWYSSSALLLAAMLLALIGLYKKRRDEPFHRSWLGLAAVFLFLSIDESAQVHEKLSSPLRDLLGTSGALHYPWVIPYGIGLLILLAIYIPFLKSLPAGTRRLVILAGLIFVSGALGMELFGAAAAASGREDGFLICCTIEEFLEMAGIVVFIHALTSYMDGHMGDLRVRITSS
jgi:hypothetical protein